ncbi:hypothetical protein [Micromonospora sp. NPDC047730]|uniref:hypothetical protein n=1 Tax=Micromonospora sp. NPDC047730 TaxID=3364253 RepID=UPI00372124F4
MEMYTVVGVWLNNAPLAVASLGRPTRTDWAGGLTDAFPSEFPQGSWVELVLADSHDAAQRRAEELMRANDESGDDGQEGDAGDDEGDEDGHSAGDGCGIYDTGYWVETDDGGCAVEDLEVGDVFEDRAYPGDRWIASEVVVVGDDVHVDVERADD